MVWVEKSLGQSEPNRPLILMATISVLWLPLKREEKSMFTSSPNRRGEHGENFLTIWVCFLGLGIPQTVLKMNLGYNFADFPSGLRRIIFYEIFRLAREEEFS